MARIDFDTKKLDGKVSTKGSQFIRKIILDGMKFCTTCKEEKSFCKFSKDKTTNDGLQRMCKDCSKKYRAENKVSISKRRKKYRENNKEKLIVVMKKYYQENKEKFSENGEKYRAENKKQIAETNRKYRENNKEKIAISKKQYQIKNKDRIAEYEQQRYQDNKIELAAYKKQYIQTERGKTLHRIAGRKRRALKYNGAYEVFDSIEIFERDGYRCQHCNKKTRPDYKDTNHPLYPNLDHIIPLSKGGDHTRLNTQCLCHLCNSKKYNNANGEQLRLFG